MKKSILMIVLLIGVFLLQACAMAPMDEAVSFDAPLYYNELSMTFTNTSEHDILYQTGNPADDFILLYRMHAENPNPTDEAIYLAFMQTLYSISMSQHVSMAGLFRLSSSELKQYFDAAGIAMSINDVVTFNTIQSEITKYKETQNSPMVSKRAYIEYRLSITLSEDDYQGLRFFQDVYSDFMYDHPGFIIQTSDFQTFKDLLNPESFSEAQFNQIETAYNYIRAIHDKN